MFEYKTIPVTTHRLMPHARCAGCRQEQALTVNEPSLSTAPDGWARVHMSLIRRAGEAVDLVSHDVVVCPPCQSRPLAQFVEGSHE